MRTGVSEVRSTRWLVRIAAVGAEDTGMNRDGIRLGVAVVIVLGVVVALAVAPNAIPALQELIGVPG